MDDSIDCMSKDDALAIPIPSHAACCNGIKDSSQAVHEDPVLVFHPVVDTMSARVLKLDATVGWARGGSAIGTPRSLMNRQTTQGELSCWSLYEACLRSKALADLESDHAAVSIAIATGELEGGGFSGSVQWALQATDLPPCHIELMFTEASLVNASPEAREHLAELSRWGVELGVSDFGAQHASFSYLQELDFATIRLDPSFTRRLATPLRNPHYPLAVLRGLLAVADELDITVVASGVETLDEMHLFRSLGYITQQGALFDPCYAGGALSTWVDLGGLRIETVTNGVAN